MSERKISLCITTYNRPELTLKSFVKVFEDTRITEIVIVDDFSRQDKFDQLYNSLLPYLNKVKLYRNQVNLGMSLNKKKAIELARNEWCIIFDSDNELDSSYIDALYDYPSWHENTIYCPSFARPSFNYTHLSHWCFSKGSQRFYTLEGFDQLINTCNYFVNREWYLKTYQHNPDVKEADTIWHNYNHLKAGGYMTVVPGMEYNHLVHKDSGWMKNRKENTRKFDEIKQMILDL